MVGAGAAGAVIAARMTERSERQVLLLEAGPDYPDMDQLPSDLVDGTRNSQRRHDWGYSHHPSPHAITLPMPRGKVVGGSSAVNTCIALRGAPADYDEWAALGLPDWTWEKCLPAFKRLEDDRDVQNEWHGQGGPVPIRRHPRSELVPWQAAFLDGCRELGLPEASDSNDPTTSGYGPHAMNKLHNVRQSAARCYLTPAVRARPNLTIAANTIVHRVVVEHGRAVGVDVEQSGVRSTLHAKRIVLCGGAIATPGILLRSGIGPAAEVTRLGATPLVENPAVGSRLLDHPGVAIFFQPLWGYSSDHPLIQNVFRFTSQGSTVPNDMQVQPGSHVPLPWFSLPFFTLAVCLGKPRVAGTMRFRSADPRAKVDIESNFLTDPADLARAMEALQVMVALGQTKAMRALGTFFFPSERVVTNPELLEPWIQKRCGSGFHPSGSVPMGPDGSPDAATDGRGRVRGLEALLVADASLMPTIPSANTHLATLMIGERFGAWLRDGEL
ncbi:MAG: GMC family oxidoreductase N-terminal domain-containing protein [Deltaproteobacteria bacterium]|nr:GMC family oxidoreductase N-terminal domain-containing protein [Deltaproteobacteria bacterium]